MFAALAIAALLQMQAAVPTTDEANAALSASAAGLRLRWLGGLDAAAWDRDRPEVRALAEGLTAEALRLRAEQPPDGTEDLDALLADLAGTALLDRVRLGPVSHARMVPGLLRAHGHAATDLLPSTVLERGVLVAAARWTPSAALPFVSSLLHDLRHNDLACHAGLALPERFRRRLVLPLAALLPDRPEDTGPACMLLAATTPAARPASLAWLARESSTPARSRTIARFSTAVPSARDPLQGLATLAVALAPERVALRVLDELTGTDLPQAPRDDVALRHALDRVTAWAPFLRATPAAITALRRLALAAEGGGWTATPTRLRWHDPHLLDDARAVLASPGTRDFLALAALRVVGLATPDEPEAQQAAQAAISQLGTRIGTAHPTLDAAALDRWSDALASGPCADDRCRTEVFRLGSDERAAREAWRLGPRGLAALPREVARGLVVRVVRRGRTLTEPPHTAPGALWSATAWAVFTRVEGCPSNLRGLAEAGRIDEFEPVLGPWRDAFARACRDAAPGVRP